MASEFSLRCYCYLNRMQPQYAAFVGTITQGDLPIEGMASLYIEMAPGNEVFRTVDIAVKATEAKPGAQVVEREFGMFEIHSLNQADVLESGRIVEQGTHDELLSSCNLYARIYRAQQRVAAKGWIE